jgi:hypothetical protein
MFGFLKRLLGANTASAPIRQGGESCMKYAPRIASAEPVARYQVAGRQAVLLDNIISAGMVQYQYILVVYERDGEPCFFVASEINAEKEAFGGGSHFLGVFPGDGHENLGDSDEWADRERFAARAFAIAQERLSSR